MRAQFVPRRTFVVALFIAFGLGCATEAVWQIPPARAEVEVKRWDHWCVDFDGKPTNPDLKRAGEEGWEMVALTHRPPVVSGGNSVGGGAMFVCFKRPH